ncbi:hypothetical protein Pan44_20900 [Caulifigura coniformis]|uniref:Carboxypeptidase regulatory-like domain-containing protein n=1 Tax=Caulifigura coniformis TaxID=2527983 RepID=A0A517SD61_9PLAN|nr:carboxypeptidase regulatory-like domain-containing protein [Caulifigura coniformis]QDT54063.1 hypothetical protein Pan44_20900 [Caulifigura coniformis]
MNAKGILLLASACLAGCTPSSGPQSEVLSTVPVAGILTYKGDPLESFRISFIPVGGDRTVSGLTDAQGRFQLGTNSPNDGAPIGKYKIAVSYAPPESADGGNPMGIEDPRQLPRSKIKVPPQFSNPEKSGVTVDIPEGGLTDLKIDLK